MLLIFVYAPTLMILPFLLLLLVVLVIVRGGHIIVIGVLALALAAVFALGGVAVVGWRRARRSAARQAVDLGLTASQPHPRPAGVSSARPVAARLNQGPAGQPAPGVALRDTGTDGIGQLAGAESFRASPSPDRQRAA